MAFLTLHEMLPLAFDHAGQKQAVKALFFGMAFMSARWVDGWSLNILASEQFCSFSNSSFSAAYTS